MNENTQETTKPDDGQQPKSSAQMAGYTPEQQAAAPCGHNELPCYAARWNYIKADPDGARALLLLLKNGNGTPDDFDAVVDRIIESRKGAGLKA